MAEKTPDLEAMARRFFSSALGDNSPCVRDLVALLRAVRDAALEEAARELETLVGQTLVPMAAYARVVRALKGKP